MSKNKKLRLEAGRRQAYRFKESLQFSKDGRKENTVPLSVWGRERNADPAILVKTPRSKRNRYQQSRKDRLVVALHTPFVETRGKLRGGLQWNNEGGVRQVWRD